MVVVVVDTTAVGKRVLSTDAVRAGVARSMNRRGGRRRCIALHPLHDVLFPTPRPRVRGNICAQHPERRPDPPPTGNFIRASTLPYWNCWSPCVFNRADVHCPLESRIAVITRLPLPS